MNYTHTKNCYIYTRCVECVHMCIYLNEQCSVVLLIDDIETFMVE